MHRWGVGVGVGGRSQDGGVSQPHQHSDDEKAVRLPKEQAAGGQGSGKAHNSKSGV